MAVLRMLDKGTARVQQTDVPVGKPVYFGTLQILVRACQQTPPEEMPEAAAFLEISELKPGEQGAMLFHGWMFASNPSLSALEHPIYDVWVTDCKNSSTSASRPDVSSPAP